LPQINADRRGASKEKSQLALLHPRPSAFIRGYSSFAATETRKRGAVTPLFFFNMTRWDCLTEPRASEITLARFVAAVTIQFDGLAGAFA